MDEPMTKPELFELIQDERARFEAILAQLDHDQMVQPGVEGEWSVKDILAHITFWEEEMMRWLKEALRDEVPRFPEDLDGLNHQVYIENRDKSLPQVLANFEDSYRQALKSVEAIPEEVLVDPGRFAWREGSPLWEMVAENTFWHYEEHGQSIAAWLEK